MATRICASPYCDKKFQAWGTRKYCTERCYRDMNNYKRRIARYGRPDPVIYKKTCELDSCRIEFETVIPHKLYCSFVHRDTARKRRQRARGINVRPGAKLKMVSIEDEEDYG